MIKLVCRSCTFSCVGGDTDLYRAKIAHMSAVAHTEMDIVAASDEERSRIQTSGLPLINTGDVLSWELTRKELEDEDDD